MSNILYVGNLNYNVTNSDLKSFFEASGEVISAKIIVDRDNDHRSKGFGFVEMGTSEEAQGAMVNLNGSSLMDRVVRVSIAEEKKPRNNNSSGYNNNNSSGYNNSGYNNY